MSRYSFMRHTRAGEMLRYLCCDWVERVCARDGCESFSGYEGDTAKAGARPAACKGCRHLLGHRNLVCPPFTQVGAALLGRAGERTRADKRPPLGDLLALHLSWCRYCQNAHKAIEEGASRVDFEEKWQERAARLTATLVAYLREHFLPPDEPERSRWREAPAVPAGPDARDAARALRAIARKAAAKAGRRGRGRHVHLTSEDLARRDGQEDHEIIRWNYRGYAIALLKRWDFHEPSCRDDEPRLEDLADLTLGLLAQRDRPYEAFAAFRATFPALVEAVAVAPPSRWGFINLFLGFFSPANVREPRCNTRLRSRLANVVGTHLHGCTVQVSEAPARSWLADAVGTHLGVLDWLYPKEAEFPDDVSLLRDALSDTYSAFLRFERKVRVALSRCVSEALGLDAEKRGGYPVDFSDEAATEVPGTAAGNETKEDPLARLLKPLIAFLRERLEAACPLTPAMTVEQARLRAVLELRHLAPNPRFKKTGWSDSQMESMEVGGTGLRFDRGDLKKAVRTFENEVARWFLRFFGL